MNDYSLCGQRHSRNNNAQSPAPTSESNRFIVLERFGSHRTLSVGKKCND